MAAIEAMVELEILPSVGPPTRRTSRCWTPRGARKSTHLQRHAPAAAAMPAPRGLLADERIVAVIPDGVTSTQGDARLAAGEGAGRHLPGDGQHALRRPPRRRLRARRAGGAWSSPTALRRRTWHIAGSVSPMDRNLGLLRDDLGVSLDDLFVMSAAVPAGLLGLSDQGAVRPGNRAATWPSTTRSYAAGPRSSPAGASTSASAQGLREASPMAEFMFATGIENSYPTDCCSRTDARSGWTRWKTGHYRRWRDDFALVEAGHPLPALRPALPHPPRPGALRLELRRRDVQRLRELEIELIVDLCHFGVPDWIGGFQNGLAGALRDYAGRVRQRFPWVRLYTPVNEIFVARPVLRPVRLVERAPEHGRGLRHRPQAPLPGQPARHGASWSRPGTGA